MTACPYCTAAINAEDARHDCPTCGVAHHAECWEENGGCTVFGCASAPGDSPAVTVAASDLAALPLSSPLSSTRFAPAAEPQPAVAPPPMPGSELSGTPPPPPPDAERVTHFSFGGYNPPAPPPIFRPVPLPMPAMISVSFTPPKNRVTYVLLGVFLGYFGAHNFYAGYKGRALSQLCITICSFFLGSVVAWIWALVEVCMVDRDANNVLMD